ncbi:HD domain-containing protein, partial [Desulfobacterales bacterium HSG16]|nr:HD domain-containing protein [Desulfobacterales bacterium HSG16]
RKNISVMNREDFARLKERFQSHVNTFYKKLENDTYEVHLKEQHTFRVCANIKLIGQSLKLSDNDLMLAESAALFHDVGRFTQYATYRTFNDQDSENHALLGLKQIGIHRMLAGLDLNEKRLISRAIAFHNVLTLPNKENERTLFFMRLLRDADKLDILEVFADYYKNRDKRQSTAVELGLSDIPVCSEKVIESLRNGQMIRIADVQSLYDFRLLKISWVYDLNFIHSFQILNERGYINAIEEGLPTTKPIADAVDSARAFIRNRLNNSV